MLHFLKTEFAFPPPQRSGDHDLMGAAIALLVIAAACLGIMAV